MRSLLVASQKGGVGKTTTAVNLAALAGGAGGRVLLVDADPLGSVAASLQLVRAPGDGPPPKPDQVTGAGTLWLGALPGVDVATPYPAADTGERHLQAFLDALPRSAAARAYDLVVVDAPPMLGPRPKALVRAADEVVVVLRAEPLSVRTLPAYLDLVQQARAGGGRCRLRGVLLTLPEGVPAGGPTESALRARFPNLLPDPVPFDPQVGRALVLGRPLVLTNPSSPAARVYADLADRLRLVEPPAPVEVAAPVGSGGGAAVAAPPKPAVARQPAAVAVPADAHLLVTRPRPADPPRPKRPAPAANPLALPAAAKRGPSGGGMHWLVVVGVLMGAAGAGLGAWAFLGR